MITELRSTQNYPAGKEDVSTRNLDGGTGVLLSVVIPTKNRPLMVRGAIRSFSDYGPSLELIVVDDCSGLQASSELRDFCHTLERCAYWRLPMGRGAGAARNWGVSVSHGKYIWFVDDDDTASVNTVRDVATALGEKVDERSVLLLPMSVRRAGREQALIMPRKRINSYEEYRARAQCVNTSCAIFAREIVLAVGGWDEKLLSGQDTDLFLRVSAHAKFICLETQPVHVNIGHPGRITTTVWRQQIGKLQFMRKHWGILTTERRAYYLVTLLLWAPVFYCLLELVRHARRPTDRWVA